MNGLDLLRHTHPTLVEESIAAFERIIARSEQVSRDLEAMQARIERRLDESGPATPEGGAE